MTVQAEMKVVWHVSICYISFARMIRLTKFKRSVPFYGPSLIQTRRN